MATKALLTASALLSFSVFVSCDLFDSIFEDVSPCEKVCGNTYSPHTFDENLKGACDRGCRFFAMVEFMCDDINNTTSVCLNSCEEAYTKLNKNSLDACQMGCKSQKPFAIQQQKADLESDPSIHWLYPVSFLYSNVVSNMMSRAQVSWSVYMQGNDGQVIVVKSDPTYFEYGPDSDEDLRTSMSMETNIEALNNAATPVLKHSQMNRMNSDDDDILDLSVRDLGTNGKTGADYSTDWLTCVANKTGVPRLILSLLLLLCALVMIWLCLSAAVTAPDQKVQADTQKLSIHGDEEVIQALLAQGIKPSYPQDRILSSLPLKIEVQRV